MFLGGDLLPHKSMYQSESGVGDSFVRDFLIRKFTLLKEKMDCMYPEVFLIPGNDDHKALFDVITDSEKSELWRNIHNQCITIGKYRLYGYACVPPTPFRIKDWERYDVALNTEPGCISPAAGYHSVPPEYDAEHDTILADLQKLIGDDALDFGVFLFHTPPFDTYLDKAELNTAQIVSVGSKAVRKFIDEKQPFITMHGHIHESARITGQWKQFLGKTCLFSAAHDGPELAVVRFELHNPVSANRVLVKV